MLLVRSNRSLSLILNILYPLLYTGPSGVWSSKTQFWKKTVINLDYFKVHINLSSQACDLLLVMSLLSRTNPSLSFTYNQSTTSRFHKTLSHTEWNSARERIIFKRTPDMANSGLYVGSIHWCDFTTHVMLSPHTQNLIDLSKNNVY